MLKSYPAIFHKDDDGSYWVEFPEFKGGTEGDDLEEAMSEAREFLAVTLSYYLDKGKKIPRPSEISEIKVEDGFVSMIQANPEPYIRGNKAVRKNVTVPEWLVVRAEREKINYSEVLTTALEKRLSVES